MRKYIYAFFTIIGLLAASCYDDKGNYDYVGVNEVKFTGGIPSSVSAIFKGEVVKITPELTFTRNQDEDNYEYEWKAVPYSLTNDNPGGTLSTERNLEYFVELLPGNYTLYLKVRDKTTGLLWMTSTPMTVRTMVGRGWLLVGEDEDGYTDVNMIAMAGTDTVVLRGLLQNNGLPPLKGPKSILHTGAYTPSADPYVRLILATDDGTYYLNTTTFAGDPEFNFRDKVFTSFDIPDRLDPVSGAFKVRGGSMNNYRMVICSNGDAFRANGLSMNGEYYDNPINRVAADLQKTFPVAPFTFSSPGSIGGWILYDTRGNRFLGMSTSASYLSVLADGETDVFPWIQPAGRTFHYGENTMYKTLSTDNQGNSFAIMKDADGSLHIYCFYAYYSWSTIPAKRGYAKIDKSLATDIDKASHFAFSSTRTLLLYAVGSKIYAYDYNKGNEKIYVRDMGDEITMLRFDIQANTDYRDLYVATYNSTTKGTLRKYKLDADLDDFILEPDENARWEGLVKVVNMDWRISDK